MSRRHAIAGLMVGGVGSTLARPSLAQALLPSAAAWGTFQERHVIGGRVIDNGNAGVSHSEGQGTAMLAAAFCGDRVRFDRIHAWTRETLRRPYDNLHAWRFRPDAAVKVDDPNNATDGDLMIAWALTTAAQRWNHKPYQTEAQAIARDVSRALVTVTPFGAMLLPGAQGFRDQKSITLNPSYYIFPALARLSRDTADPVLARVAQDGLKLVRAARFGRWGLPPDWLTLLPTGHVTPSDKWPARFSFDAVRVPLYLCWSGYEQDVVVDAVNSFWSHEEAAGAPAWTDVTTEEMAPYRLTPGMQAIRRYVSSVRRRPGTATEPAAKIPKVSTATDYYSAALIMLVHLALEDGGPRLS